LAGADTVLAMPHGDDHITAERNGRASLTEKVYVALKQDILSGRLGPDAPIVESSLAQRFRVSKTPVREALRQLVHEGLVMVLPRKGYIVRPVGLVDVMEVLALRGMVEPPLAAEAARRCTAQDAEALRLLAEREAALRPGLEELRISLDVHAHIARMAGNGRAAALVDSLLDETARVPWLSPRLRIGSSAEEHARIVAAVATGDAEAAARQMTVHLDETRARTLIALGAG
jgi:DNA-binding GntR family transcriptional regulator